MHSMGMGGLDSRVIGTGFAFFEVLSPLWHTRAVRVKEPVGGVVYPNGKERSSFGGGAFASRPGGVPTYLDLWMRVVSVLKGRGRSRADTFDACGPLSIVEEYSAAAGVGYAAAT